MTYPKHWALVPIPSGSKGPTRKGWNLRENCQLPPGWTGNVGLAHAYSGTCALDLDRLADAEAYLAEHSIDLASLLDAPDAVQISSGREGRAKLLYLLPEPLPTKALAKGALELRCGTDSGLTMQDVLPPSVHPDTGQPYTWIGDHTQIPPIPPALLALWKSLCKPRVDINLNIAAELPELDTVLKMLAKHSNNAPYDSDDGDSFIKIGMAIHDATDGSPTGLEIWDAFLSTGVKYEEGRAHLASHWRSFSKGKGVTWKWLLKGVTVEACDFSPLADVDDIDLSDDAVVAHKGINAPDGSVNAPNGPVMRRKRNGRIESNYLNIHTAVANPDFCGLHIGYDTFRAELMQSMSAARDRSLMSPFMDNHYGQLRRALETRGFDSTSTDNIRQAVAEVGAKHTFDSAADWLNALQHDGEARCVTFLRDYFGAQDTEYSRAVSMYLWTALAARVLSPGCQADMAVIMVSSQGERKSTGISSLVPRAEQFVELNLDESDADLARQMSGCLVGELSELRGLASRDLESIKSFITRKHEKWVPKYKEFAQTYPRRLILIGTTNKREFLADETGERRFLPVDVLQARPEAIQRDRDQLWAEGRELYGLIGIAWQRAEELGRQAVKAYKVSDSWDEPIAQWLSKGDFEGSLEVHADREFSTVDVAAGALGIDIKHVNRAAEMRIARVLHGLGFIKKQVKKNGFNNRSWIKR